MSLNPSTASPEAAVQATKPILPPAAVASLPFSKLSAWGAIVVTARRGQLAWVSGRSKASKNG